MLNNYINYLEVLRHKLNGFFKQQKPYIFCKKGCAKCCQNGEYPFSQIEFELLRVGFMNLPPEIQQKIVENISVIKAHKANNNAKVFTYECPFLINNECSLYPYRGIISRTFGLYPGRRAGGLRFRSVHTRG